VAQLTLFESTDTVFVDDERGRVTYTARFVDAETAGRWFAELRTTVSWHSERRMMCEREVDVPRLMPKRALHVDLEPGSLLVMDYSTQLHYTHGVPKTTDLVRERISLAFRVKRPRASGIYR